MRVRFSLFHVVTGRYKISYCSSPISAFVSDFDVLTDASGFEYIVRVSPNGFFYVFQETGRAHNWEHGTVEFKLLYE